MRFAVDFDNTVVEEDRPYDDVTTPLKLIPGAREGLQALKAAGHLLLLWSGRASRALLADPELDSFISAGVVRSNRETWLSSRAIHLARYEQMIRFVEDELPGIFDAIDDGTAGKPLVDYFLDDKAMKFGRSSGGLGWSTITQFYGEFNSTAEQTSVEKVAQVISLDTPIAELELVPTDRLRTILDTIRVELRSAGITRFEPVFALGDSGFWCADRALTINIPWFLATPELYELAQQRYPMKWLDVARGVRHEVGHAINYTFELWKRKDWTELFGDFRLPYPELEGSWPVDLDSPDFVEYVRDSGPGYGQRHPDDDWAETFACWLDPTSDLTQYRDGALRKLQYVESVAREVLASFPVNNDLGVPKQWRAAFPGQTVREALFRGVPSSSTTVPSKSKETAALESVAVTVHSAHGTHQSHRWKKVATVPKSKIKDAEGKEHPGGAPGSQLPANILARLKEVGVSKLPPSHIKDIEIHDRLHSKGSDVHAGALIKWTDDKGRGQIGLSSEAVRLAHERVFARTEALRPKMPALKAELERQAPTSPAHAAAALIADTGLRRGSDDNLPGHYGALTMECRHVKFEGGAARIEYVGKEGMVNRATVTNPVIVKAIRAQAAGKAPTDKLWPEHVNETSVQATLLPGMKIKDLRTIAASDLAEKTLGSIKPTLTGNAKTDAREIGRINKEVSATVATKLNNAPAQAFKSYIAPTLFMAWGKNNGVPPEWLVTLSPKGK